MWWESISERDKASGGLQKLIPDIVDYMDCMDCMDRMSLVTFIRKEGSGTKNRSEKIERYRSKNPLKNRERATPIDFEKCSVRFINICYNLNRSKIQERVT